MTSLNKITFFIIIFSALILPALASTKADITFPVTELNNCKDEADCKSYCDIPDNYVACFAFAKKHNLLEGPLADKSEKELRKFAQIMIDGGPGNCQNQNECDTYCNNVNNINECVVFAEKHNLMSPRELDEAKKIRDALARGIKMPGGCTNKDTCENYCFGSQGSKGGRFIEDHMDECVTFGIEAGFMNPKEEKMARLTGGRGPGGCRGSECDDFCDNPNNMKVCNDFLENLMRKNPNLKLEDIIPEDDLKEMRGGFEKMKNDMSPEMILCLSKSDSNIAAFFKGVLPASPKLGMKIKKIMPGCLREFLGEDTSPELIDCMMKTRDKEAGDKCFEKYGFPGNFGPPQSAGSGHDGPPNFPPEVEKCVKDRGLWNKMMSLRGPPSPEIEKEIEKCFTENFIPEVYDGDDLDFESPKDDSGSGFPRIGPDPEQCMREASNSCDKEFVGGAGQQKCKETAKKRCFENNKKLVPRGFNKPEFGFSSKIQKWAEKEKEGVKGLKEKDFHEQFDKFQNLIPNAPNTKNIELSKLEIERLKIKKNIQSHEIGEEFMKKFDNRLLQEEFRKQYQKQYQQTFKERFQKSLQSRFQPTSITPSQRGTSIDASQSQNFKINQSTMHNLKILDLNQNKLGEQSQTTTKELPKQTPFTPKPQQHPSSIINLFLGLLIKIIR